MLRYPIHLTPDDNDTLLVTCPDFPELKSFGDDEADACAHAADALATVIAARIADALPVPAPSPTTGASAVLGTGDTLKIALYQAMRADGVTADKLAERLRRSTRDVERLLDLMQPADIGDLESALLALGRDITIVVDRAA